MKKVLFVIDSLRKGGISTSLMSLLRVIDLKKYNISLFSFHYDATACSQIDPRIKVLNTNAVLDLCAMTSDEAKRKSLVCYFARKMIAFFCFLFGSRFVYNIVFKRIKHEGEYDIAISFTNNIGPRSLYFGPNKYVLDNVKALKKITWLHVDFIAFHLDKHVNVSEYTRFDSIVCVSHAVRRSILQNHPEFGDKTRVIYNVMPVLKIDADDFLDVLNLGRDARYKLVTVGRLDRNKNIMSCVLIAKQLVDAHIDFVWYFLGEGPQKKRIEKQLLKYSLKKNCFLLGHIDKPSCFYRACDLFVSTSLTESFGMAIYEAHHYSLPTVALYYPAAEELIINGLNGYVENTIADMTKRIISLLEIGAIKALKQSCRPIIFPELSINDTLEELFAI